MPLQDGIEIHFGHELATIEHSLLRDNLEAFGQQIGFDAPMGFDNADNDVYAIESPASRRCEHLVRFPDAWSCAQENFEAPPAFPVRLLQQNFR
jgi:hypothetical protein